MARNRRMVPEAAEALDRLKMESAREVGVDLKRGYNGDLPSRQAGSVGGQMVNMMIPKRQWTFTRVNRRSFGHCDHILLSMEAGI